MNSEKKSFLVAMATIFILMLITYALTFILDCKGIEFYKFVLSPILVLGSSTGITTISICIFLLLIGGISNCLTEGGFVKYILSKIVNNYKDKKYKLLFIFTFFFMVLGSLIGMLEEIIPITPFVVTLAISLGFDKLTGIAISLLAVGCGFAAGVCNPFNVGVAQGILNIPMFSGIYFRIVVFILIYILLMTFIILYCKKIDKGINTNVVSDYVYDEIKEKASLAFACILGFGLLIVLCSSFLTFLQDYTIIIIGLSFLFAGIVCARIAKMPTGTFWKYFKKGAFDIALSIPLILMASSIKYIMEESVALETIVDVLIGVASRMSKIELILFIYLICLVLEVFVPSGSAKAFLLMPIIAPLAAKYGVSSQLVILAYAFGDGFSNVFYPTNPALIICLNLSKVEYKEWFKYSFGFQLINLIMTSGILIVGLFIGY